MVQAVLRADLQAIGAAGAMARAEHLFADQQLAGPVGEHLAGMGQQRRSTSVDVPRSRRYDSQASTLSKWYSTSKTAERSRLNSPSATSLAGVSRARRTFS
jgi:hypothetical protein